MGVTRFVLLVLCFLMIKFRATSHTRLIVRDHYISSTLIGGKGGANPSLLHTMLLEGPTEYVNDARWMWSLHGFLHGIEWIMLMATWTLFRNHFLEVGQIQNGETMALWTHTTVGLSYFIMFWWFAWIMIHWYSIWLRAWSRMTSHYTWGSVTTLHDFGGVLGQPLDTLFCALTISWSRVLARMWSGPYFSKICVALSKTRMKHQHEPS